VNDRDYTREAQKHWNRTPCGTGHHLAGLEYGSLEFFEAIRHSRYEVTDRWMKRTIDFTCGRNKRLLEIGHGLGTDLLTFCEAGAEVYGIDIAEEHHRLAKRNFALHGRQCVLKLCNCAEIDFPSEFFDVVYSHGVLHHTTHTVRGIGEAYRVLKPGGLFIMSLYHTWSAFHLFNRLLVEGLVKGRLRKLGYRGLMATVENGADGMEIKPLVKTYTKRQLRLLLEDFSTVRLEIAHFQRGHLPKIGRLMPIGLERALEPYVGWYVVAFATR
jgi:ubiquinone/menaquinone biosynthesis C-methylase UbiE